MQKRSFQVVLACGIAAASSGWAQTVTSTQALAFGSFAAGTGGTITISPTGTRSASGGVILVPSGSGSAASFNVSGTSNATYAITLPANGMVSLASGANAMAVNNFVSNPSSSGQLSIGGSQTLTVGATLSVGSNQPSGTYSGAFNITVNYN